MFNLLASRKGTNCDGNSRRDFLKVGALGLGGLALPDLLRARAAAAAESGKPTRNTSVVWLWLGGGPTHIETFDPKMSAPAEFRTTVGAVQTNVPGIEIGGVFPEMAKVADKMAFVRSFAHRNSGHGGGTHWVMTGYDFPPADNGQAPIKPGFGSILARHRGPNNVTTGLPTYVRIGGILGDGPAWLGSPYAPFDVGGNARNNMNLKVALDHLGDRRKLLKGFDTLNRDLDRSGLMSGLDSFETQAFDLILSRAREAFDVTREDPRIRDPYGPRLGQQLLHGAAAVRGRRRLRDAALRRLGHARQHRPGHETAAGRRWTARCRRSCRTRPSAAWTRTSCWSSPASSAARRASTAAPAATTGRRSRRWPWPAAA